jgi:hypothetical protein
LWVCSDKLKWSKTNILEGPTKKVHKTDPPPQVAISYLLLNQISICTNIWHGSIFSAPKNALESQKSPWFGLDE